MLASELNLGTLSFQEAVDFAADYADKLNSTPQEQVEALIERLANTAVKTKSRISQVVFNQTTLNKLDLEFITPAVIERAERRLIERQHQIQERIKMAAKAENPNDQMPLLPKKPDGWWLDARQFSPDVPEYGPYTSKQEALEVRASFLRSMKRQGRPQKPKLPDPKTCNHEYKTSGNEVFCKHCFEPKDQPKKTLSEALGKKQKKSKPVKVQQQIGGEAGADIQAIRKEAARKAWETRKKNLAAKGGAA